MTAIVEKILAQVGEKDVLAFLGKKAPSPVTEEYKKEKKAIDEKRKQLADARFRQCEVLLCKWRSDADNKEAADAFEKAHQVQIVDLRAC